MRTPPEAEDDRVSAHIQRLRPDRIYAAGNVLAASHFHDPAYCYLFPHPYQRLLALRTLYTDLVRDALPFGAVYGALRNERVLGAAIWLPPMRFPSSLARKVRSTLAILGVGLIAPRAFPAFVRMGTQAEQTHPPEPVWYLEGLGVDPQAQGGGLGTRLLAPILARADTEGVACYLEIANPRNLSFYQRLGFQVA